jgi:IS30 family transposase
MKRYSQLTLEKRYGIYTLLKTGLTQSKIAEVIGIHKSTVSRELKRNRGGRDYRPKQADALDDNLQILEVKFTNYLPQTVKYILNSIQAIPHSISKYTLCQRYINYRPWTDKLLVPF